MVLPLPPEANGIHRPPVFCKSGSYANSGGLESRVAHTGVNALAMNDLQSRLATWWWVSVWFQVYRGGHELAQVWPESETIHDDAMV